METLGSFLKKARELKNISQEDLAKFTCYHVSRIQALEEDQHENLPPIPYVKGMLRSISKYLGLDVNDVLLQYENFLNSQPKSAPVSSQSALEISEVPFYMQKNFLLVSATVSFVVLVIVASFLFREPKQVKPIGDIPAPEAETSSGVSLGKEGVSQAQGYKCVIQAPKDIWLKVQIDSEAPYPLPVKSGGSVELHAKKVLRFFISDAQGVKFTLNDKEMPHSLTGAKTFIFPSGGQPTKEK